MHNIIFICTGQLKNLSDSLGCDIHFIEMVWNRARDISKCACFDICQIFVSSPDIFPLLLLMCPIACSGALLGCLKVIQA